MTTKFKTAYHHPKVKGISFLDEDGKTSPSRTKQSFKAECDINNIIKKYDKTGLLTHVNHAIAQYGDFTETNEFQDALNLVETSKRNFSQIPSEIRNRFGNNAGIFLEFATNPKNIDEMVSLGLAIKPEIIKETIQKVEIITEKTPLKEETKDA